MASFRYKAYDRAGRIVQGVIDAASRDRALAGLHAQGLAPAEIAEAGASKSKPWWQLELSGTSTLDLDSLATLTHELATLLTADIPLDEALRIVSLQPMLKDSARKAVTSLLELVSEGQSLHGAMRHLGYFPEYYWRLVQAGEASGALGRVVQDLAAHLERSRETRQQIRAALTYPLFLLFAAACSMVVIAAILIPAIGPLLEGSGRATPLFVSVALATQKFVSEHLEVVIGGSILELVLIVAAWRQPSVIAAVHKFQLRAPLISGLVVQREISHLARGLETMLRAGVPLLEALSIASGSQFNRIFSAGLTNVVDDVSKGASLAQALSRTGLFTELSLRLVSVGEQTGQLELMFGRLATIYEQSLQRDLKRVTSMIAPALTLIIGVLVGGLMLSVMQALLSFNEMTLQ